MFISLFLVFNIIWMELVEEIYLLYYAATSEILSIHYKTKSFYSDHLFEFIIFGAKICFSFFIEFIYMFIKLLMVNTLNIAKIIKFILITSSYINCNIVWIMNFLFINIFNSFKLTHLYEIVNMGQQKTTNLQEISNSSNLKQI